PTRPGPRSSAALAAARASSSSGGLPRRRRIGADEMTDPAPNRHESIDPARAEAAARLPSRIAFLGFGLIGGSIAAALRDAGSTAALTSWTPAGRGPDAGVHRGLVATASRTAEEAVDGADLVILAGPPLAIADALAGGAGAIRAGLADEATV